MDASKPLPFGKTCRAPASTWNRPWATFKNLPHRECLAGTAAADAGPTVRPAAEKPGIYVCGEYGSVPGIQWALLSGRQAAEEVLKMMNSNR